MTTAGPDGVLTAADLLFGSSEDAHEALTRHVMSAAAPWPGPSCGCRG